ncbi:hypothetical protein V6615_10790 [Oscillospiraceae bacterium PP1C4]
MIYTGKLWGKVQTNEYHEIDYGKQGVTQVGINYPQENVQEQKRNRATLVSIAQMVIEGQTGEKDRAVPTA